MLSASTRANIVFFKPSALLAQRVYDESFALVGKILELNIHPRNIPHLDQCFLDLQFTLLLL